MDGGGRDGDIEIGPPLVFELPVNEKVAVLLDESLPTDGPPASLLPSVVVEFPLISLQKRKHNLTKTSSHCFNPEARIRKKCRRNQGLP